jgi:ATP-dependent DNA helicase RecG
MADTVAAPARGLELFAPPRLQKPLTRSGKQGEGLEKLGIRSVQDLLQHYPRYHVDRRNLRTIRELKEAFDAGEAGGEVQVLAKVSSMGRPVPLPNKGGKGKSRRTLIKGVIEDGTGKISVSWFNLKWIGQALQPGTEAFFYGRLGRFRSDLQMTAPRFEPVRTGKEPFNVGRIIPIYPATADLSSDQLRRIIWDTLNSLDGILDPVPREIARALGLMGRGDALRCIHFPDEKEEVIQARRRLVFDEVFTLQLGLVYRKRLLERTVQGISHGLPAADSLAEAFVGGLPFELTGAQRRACGEVAKDMNQSYPMHRLVEGEVGSGKTVVALYACLVAIEGGYQAAFMAPTEVLAEQHSLTLAELLDRAFGSDEARNLFATVSRRPVVRLLTGSTPAAKRAEILSEVALGHVDLLVGTHALIQETVEFQKLGVAVVDEQHRFGVHQRRSLREKGVTGEPDILVMTATPIPRTLAVTIYGDLDVSVLDELPKGRQPIITKVLEGERGRESAYSLIRSEVAKGRQAFVVYALREESDKTDLRSAKAEAKRLASEVFPDLSVDIVHGDMKSVDKEAAMARMREGETDVLVATTVIEVGVDIPNATVMLIEDAERFGLAQLHQLRGRIGRGGYESYCGLCTDLDLSKADEDAAIANAAERLYAVQNNINGFDLAEKDLEFRGEGQLFGARQSGMPQLKMTRVLKHKRVIQDARDRAVSILDEDPELRAYEHQELLREMRFRYPEETLEVIRSG